MSQWHDGSEFNIPSKLMNFMAYGIPVLAAVNPDGEVARIVERLLPLVLRLLGEVRPS